MRARAVPFLRVVRSEIAGKLRQVMPIPAQKFHHWLLGWSGLLFAVWNVVQSTTEAVSISNSSRNRRRSNYMYFDRNIVVMKFCLRRMVCVSLRHPLAALRKYIAHQKGYWSKQQLRVDVKHALRRNRNSSTVPCEIFTE